MLVTGTGRNRRSSSQIGLAGGMIVAVGALVVVVVDMQTRVLEERIRVAVQDIRSPINPQTPPKLLTEP